VDNRDFLLLSSLENNRALGEKKGKDRLDEARKELQKRGRRGVQYRSTILRPIKKTVRSNCKIFPLLTKLKKTYPTRNWSALETNIYNHRESGQGLHRSRHSPNKCSTSTRTRGDSQGPRGRPQSKKRRGVVIGRKEKRGRRNTAEEITDNTEDGKKKEKKKSQKF